ncbi:MAG: orotate phosphoribosyltransferase [Candidatus Aminicenantes bacterium]|nr:orotate phosphoribosyltransferase [Candidatus Aminicenantes bacterium]
MKDRLKEILREVSLEFGDFVLASGKRSSYYIDARMTSLHPEGLYLLSSLLLEEIMKIKNIEAVGGMSIGADPIVSGIIVMSQLKGTPLKGFLVRKEKKAHGRGKRIEGWIKEGARVVLVEDVVTTGGSLLKAAEAVEEEGGIIKHCFAVIDRGGGKEISSKYPFSSLFKIDEILEGKNG